MAKDLNMSDDGDLVFTAGTLTFVDEDELIRQNLIKLIRTYTGEWFLDESIGLPWYQVILVKGVEVGTIEDIFVAAILSVAGVKEIVKLDIDFNSAARNLTVTFEVITVNGNPLTISESN